MDRYRLNQILRVLLFPVCDPEMGKNDLLLEKYLPYQNFMDHRDSGLEENYARNRNNEAYKKAENKLLEYLTEMNAGRAKSVDELKLLCDLYYPMKDIYCQIGRISEKRREKKKSGAALKEYIALYYIQKLVQISRSLLTYRDGIVSIRTQMNNDGKDIFAFSNIFNKVEIWNFLCRMTVPDIYIAMYAVESGNDVTALSEQKEGISLADSLLRKRLENGTAENHLHFHAGYHYEMYWLYGMDIGKWRRLDGRKLDGRKRRMLEAAFFRCFAALFLQERERGGMDVEFSDWLKGNCRGRATDYLKAMQSGREVPGAFSAQDRQALSELYERIGGSSRHMEYDVLLESVYAEYLDLRTSSEFIFLYYACRYIKHHGLDVGFAHFFVQYLRIKNRALSELQETHEMQGLRYFQKKYRSVRRALPDAAGRKETILEIFRSQNRITSLKKMELRIAPYTNQNAVVSMDYEKDKGLLIEGLCRQLYEILYAYRRSILENLLGLQETRRYLREEEWSGMSGNAERLACSRVSIKEKIKKECFCVPTLGIVFHFIKSIHLSNDAGYFCWRSVWQGGRMQTDYSMVNRQYLRNIALAVQELRGKIPYLGEYLVGIDAASDENAMEPWMFAPAYRALHADQNARVRMEEEKLRHVKSIRFTYHVGEDFRHILSGLRHIDEVLEEFHYQAGDRLGHALALGIDPAKWITENEVVSMPRQEWLEDLLWVWGKKVYDEVSLPLSIERLEHRIISIAEQIYLHCEELSVRMLYQAYRKKFEDQPLEDQSGMAKPALCKNVKNKVFCYYENTEEETCYNGWTVEKLCLTNYCPVFAEKYSEVIHIPVPQERVELFGMLQEHLIEKVEKMGVYIETNPTSNLTIGDFAQMREHPIFRWNAIRDENGHHTFVMINSDDPAVFHTNVENELAYIYYAAEYQGYSKEEALDWVDKIRQNGIDGSFVEREKSANEILDETEIIMKCLRNRM